MFLLLNKQSLDRQILKQFFLLSDIRDLSQLNQFHLWI